MGRSKRSKQSTTSKERNKKSVYKAAAYTLDYEFNYELDNTSTLTEKDIVAMYRI